MPIPESNGNVPDLSAVNGSAPDETVLNGTVVDATVPIESAIAAGMAAGDTEAVMRAVASIEVMVPQTGAIDGDAPDGAMSLPVIEQDGTSYVPVFTSEATMNKAAPDIGGAISVPVAALGANWPSDELWLAVNPGTEGGLTLPPDAVKSLPSYAS
jgi:SseB protein N-terminal domain